MRRRRETPQKFPSARAAAGRKAFGLLPINSIKVETEVRITLPPLAIRWRAGASAGAASVRSHRPSSGPAHRRRENDDKRTSARSLLPGHFTQAQAGETPLSAKLAECRFHQRTAGFLFVVLLRPSRCMNPSNSPAGTIPEIKTNRFALDCE